MFFHLARYHLEKAKASDGEIRATHLYLVLYYLNA